MTKELTTIFFGTKQTPTTKQQGTLQVPYAPINCVCSKTHHLLTGFVGGGGHFGDILQKMDLSGKTCSGFTVCFSLIFDPKKQAIPKNFQCILLSICKSSLQYEDLKIRTPTNDNIVHVLVVDDNCLSCLFCVYNTKVSF